MLCECVNVTPVVLDVCMLITSTKRLAGEGDCMGSYAHGSWCFVFAVCERGDWRWVVAPPPRLPRCTAPDFQLGEGGRAEGEGLERKHFVKGLTVNRVSNMSSLSLAEPIH